MISKGLRSFSLNPCITQCIRPPFLHMHLSMCLYRFVYIYVDYGKIHSLETLNVWGEENGSLLDRSGIVTSVLYAFFPFLKNCGKMPIP